jgi:hypothetical protein
MIELVLHRARFFSQHDIETMENDTIWGCMSKPSRCGANKDRMNANIELTLHETITLSYINTCKSVELL